MRISDWSSDVCSSDLGGHPELGDAAATFGQGDGSALLKLHGPAAMLMLQKGFFVDLRSALGAKDSCVCSVVAHVNVIAWTAGSDPYGVAVDRKSVVSGKSVSVRVDLGGRCSIKKKKPHTSSK